MRRFLLFSSLLLALSGKAAADCPEWSVDAERFAQLRAEIRQAPDQATGKALSDEMWAMWSSAPDARAQAMLDRGMRARSSYDYDAAIAAFDDLVAYCPNYAEGYNQRAFINFLRQNYAPALDDLESALERNPDHIAARAGMALTLLHMGRMRAGQAVLRDALEMNPWLPERGYLVELPDAEAEPADQ